MAAEDIGFPFAAQAALLTCQQGGRKDERLGLIADLWPHELPAQAWRRANRQGWGIENGTPPSPKTRLNPSCIRTESVVPPSDQACHPSRPR